MKQSNLVKGGRQFAVAALLAGLLTPCARAQEAVSTNAPVTLEALVTEAMRGNPELKFYQAEIDAARAGRTLAGKWANPEISGTVGQKIVRGGGGPGAEGVAWSASVLQPFEWPGRIGLRKAIANRDLELAGLGLERFRLALAGQVRTLAYGVLAAQEKAAAARAVAERFKTLREVLVQRDPAGLTPLLETRVIEATELNTQRKASAATLATQAALLELNQLRGVAPEVHLSIQPAQLAFQPPETMEGLLALARTNNFEARVRRIELAQQGFRVDLAKNERFPPYQSALRSPRNARASASASSALAYRCRCRCGTATQATSRWPKPARPRPKPRFTSRNVKLNAKWSRPR